MVHSINNDIIVKRKKFQLNITHAFSKLRNGNIKFAAGSVDKDYIKIVDFQVLEVI